MNLSVYDGKLEKKPAITLKMRKKKKKNSQSKKNDEGKSLQKDICHIHGRSLLLLIFPSHSSVLFFIYHL